MRSRARILLDVLEFLDRGDDDDLADLEVTIARTTPRDPDGYLGDIIAQWAEQRMLQMGSSEDLLRTNIAVEPPRTPDTSVVDCIPPELVPDFVKFLTEALEELKRRGNSVASSADTEERQLDALDAYYARIFLQKLPEAVQRVYSFQRLHLTHRPPAPVAHLFEEAMRCYIMGYEIASVSLCRALLEASLEDVVGPGRVYDLIERARGKDLSPERADCASRIYGAGNLAMHDLPSFYRRWGKDGALALLTDTRKVVEELYHCGDAR
ncbi:MAG: hypothetical protein ACM3JB_06855 [Acidobacteriaceae bacterium]